MTRETLEQDINDAILKLVEIVEDTCWNNISENRLFILSEIKNDQHKNFFKQRSDRKRTNDKKQLLPLESAIAQLETIYEDLYEIDLNIYQAKKEMVIIEIQYYLKSSLDKAYFEEVKDNEPMLHCKVGIPPYQKSSSGKYDVNWELGGLRHNWKMFWWRRKSTI